MYVSKSLNNEYMSIQLSLNKEAIIKQTPSAEDLADRSERQLLLGGLVLAVLLHILNMSLAL